MDKAATLSSRAPHVFPNRDKYLVIGGHGSVGRVVCQYLEAKFPGRVVAAGRSVDAAAHFESSPSGRVTSIQLDVRDPVMLDAVLSDALVVITCIDTRNREIAKACIRHGAHFVDISASYPVLQSLQALDDGAKASGVTGVLSVGLAPGITNLLVRHVRDVLGGVHSAEITVLLGLGDTHGRDAIRWMLENSRALGEAKRIQLPQPYGMRAAYAFDFADQHVVRHSLGIAQVRTRLCLEPAWMTRALGVVSASGALALLGRMGALDRLAGLLSAVRFGSDAFVAQVDAQGDEGGWKVHSSGPRPGSINTVAQIQAAVPGLEAWLKKVFTVMGGFMAGTGVLAVFVATVAMPPNLNGTSWAIALAGALTVALMS